MEGTGVQCLWKQVDEVPCEERGNRVEREGLRRRPEWVSISLVFVNIGEAEPPPVSLETSSHF